MNITPTIYLEIWLIGLTFIFIGSILEWAVSHLREETATAQYAAGLSLAFLVAGGIIVMSSFIVSIMRHV